MREERMEPPQLSAKMAVLRYRDKRLILGAILAVIGLSGALACFFLYAGAKSSYRESQSHPVLFDSARPGGYSKISLQYMTDSFAEYVKTGDKYYFGFDFMFRPYVISIRGDLPQELSDLVAYTYGTGEEEAPHAVNVYGYGEPLIPELLGYARESYSLMWEESQIPITMEELTKIVGNYYLDTAPKTFEERYPWSAAFYLVPEALLFAGAALLARFLRDYRYESRQLAARAEEIREADAELASACRYGAGLSLYLTPHFIVSGAHRLEVVPYRSISRVEHSGGYVIAVTRDQRAHIVAKGKKYKALAGEIMRDIQGRIAEAGEAEGEKTETEGDNHEYISGN